MFNQGKLLVTLNNRVIFSGWRLFRRKREWRELVENIMCYFPHMVCEIYLTIQL